MKEFILDVALIVLLLVIGISAHAQTFVPVVNPDMIEISFDGVVFQDATAYTSGISISTGVAAGNHIFHARRGSIIHWEGQLGTPYTSEKVEWFLDTNLLPAVEHKIYMRFQFGVEEPVGSGLYITSEMSEISDVLKLIGRPDKARRNG